MAFGVEQIYVLHVKHGYEDRAESIESQSRKHGFSFEYILDWDTEELNYEVLGRFFALDSQLTEAQQSLCLKHYEALKRVSARSSRRPANPHEKCLIFEDDVLLGRDFGSRLSACLVEAKNLPENVILCIGSGCNLFTERKRLIKSRMLYPATQMRAADSYVLSRGVAQILVEYIEENGFDRPYDHYLDSIVEALNIRIYWLEPPVVVQGSQNGTFQTSLYKQKPLLYKRVHWALERFRRQYWS